MVETRPFKTKLCFLYQRGRCDRQTCTFAHGNNELHHFPGSFAERRGNRGDDLRNKLDRKRSPEARYSPGRDSRGPRAFRRFSPPPPHKRRKYRTHLDMDGHDDFQRTFRSPEGTPDRNKDKKLVASDFKSTVPEELQQVQYEVDMLLDQKSQLKIQLEERVQEADSLSSRIMDLEAQLSEEKDKFKRVNSKIKTLIRAHAHHSRLKDQVKKSQLQFEELVEELGKNATQIDGSEDNLNVNIISDEEIADLKDSVTLRKRPLTCSTEVPQGSKPGNNVRGHGANVEVPVRSSHLHLDSGKDAKLDNRREETGRPSRESKSIRRKDASKCYVSSDKANFFRSGVPPTSMAAHAVDDFVELTEADDNLEGVEVTTSSQSGMALPAPPLSSKMQNNFSQHESDDENVNVDEVDAEH
ncbi:zinc finger CCCH domain-containing protein 13 [Silene latifolia]|uniref:zinc finger CCCH domain-containing protein 13 n=1 Tax=Silene latifolia TaxID=37657 RepID=UPI003D782B7C